MGIDVELQNETGDMIQHVSDPQGDIVTIVQTMHGDEASKCLRFVDPFGNTIFNTWQMPTLIGELQEAMRRAPDHDAKNAGRKILNLANQAARSLHVYLKFIGD
jgi:hypothetical protein